MHGRLRIKLVYVLCDVDFTGVPKILGRSVYTCRIFNIGLPQRKNHKVTSLGFAVANDEGLCLYMNDVQSSVEDNYHSSTVGPIHANEAVPHLAEK